MKARIMLAAFSMVVVSACSAAGTPAALQHIVWQVTEMSGSPVHLKRQLTLEFEPDRFIGNGLCNSFEGQGAFPSPGRIDLSGLSQTLKACLLSYAGKSDDLSMGQDAIYFETLRKMTAYRLEPDGSLLLTAPDGDSIRLRNAGRYDLFPAPRQ